MLLCHAMTLFSLSIATPLAPRTFPPLRPPPGGLFVLSCVWADEEYGLVGLLVGLAVYSGVILDVPLPLVVFKKVLGEQLSLKACTFEFVKRVRPL